jgi:hypothetical protein
MNCSDVEELVQSQLDGEPIIAPAELDQHLANCEPCRELLAASQLLLEGLEATRHQAVQVPDFFSEKMVRTVLRDQRMRQLQRRVWTVGALAAAASILLACWLLIRPDGNGGNQNIANAGSQPKNGQAAHADGIEVAAAPEPLPPSLLADAMTAVEGVPIVQAPKQASPELRVPARDGNAAGLQLVRSHTRKAMSFMARESAAGSSAR